ncbi:MAG: hypothetical protein C4532_17105 [Candidatus Abyssobacteria bacterium SURF_17]|uniref:Restriction endonuclease n=1 Tax=Candidatus Abyssobacteria bacterium SURF_17 TaxID=2093361 RepID=A0A419ERI1_9BACT|nr:MAG: hypothetical protein C4532_17105 [Candidatus Abyssubacteria bacterium SURF_17]
MKSPEEISKQIEVLLQKRDCLSEVLSALLSEIPREIYTKIEAAPYFALWQTTAKWFEENGRFFEANSVFEALYQELNEAQKETSLRIHKGMPLVWLSDNYLRLEQPWHAQRFLLLTIIEDAIANNGLVNPNTTGSYHRAVWYFGMADELFRKYAKEAHELYLQDQDLGKFPEWILLYLSAHIAMKYPIYHELDSYPLNRSFAKYWFGKLCSSGKNLGRPFEDFCALLLSCIPGFEVKMRASTQDYHFDALVRNKSISADFRKDFGNYLATESKNWEKPVQPDVIAYFASRLVFHDMKSGILFSKNGITGERDNRNAALTLIKSFYKIGRIIMVVNEEDIQEIIQGRNLINLLQEKYEQTRFGTR